MNRNCDLQRAVDFVSENARKYPWHKLTGPNFELAEWQAAIESVRQNQYYRFFINFKNIFQPKKYRVLFRPEAEIQQRTVPNINDDDDNDERKVFEKVPEEMAQKLNEIINEVSYLFLLFIVGCNDRGRLSGFITFLVTLSPVPVISVSRPDRPFGWFSSDRFSRVIGVD